MIRGSPFVPVVASAVGVLVFKYMNRRTRTQPLRRGDVGRASSSYDRDDGDRTSGGREGAVGAARRRRTRTTRGTAERAAERTTERTAVVAHSRQDFLRNELFVDGHFRVRRTRVVLLLAVAPSSIIHHHHNYHPHSTIHRHHHAHHHNHHHHPVSLEHSE